VSSLEKVSIQTVFKKQEVTVEAKYTNGHKALRGLSATTELLVFSSPSHTHTHTHTHIHAHIQLSHGLSIMGNSTGL